MHIPDGLLPAQVYVGGYAIASLTTWYSLRQIRKDPDYVQNIPKASLLTAAFFIASSIHIPIPPISSVHFVLNGLLGTVLGYFAFPAIVIGLLFQAVMFGHGGLTSLGVNALLMGIPALLAFHVFQIYRLLIRGWSARWALGTAAFLAGAIGLGLSALIFVAIIITTIPSDIDAAAEQVAVYALTMAHIPLMILEGLFTAMLVLFLKQVKPELINFRRQGHEV